MNSLSLKELSEVVVLCKKNSIMPKIVKTRKQANEMNKQFRVLGLKYAWMVGDAYYDAVPIAINQDKKGINNE